MATFQMKIANHPIELRSLSDELMGHVSDRYGGFATDESPLTVFELQFPENMSKAGGLGGAEAFFGGDDVRYRRNDFTAVADGELREVRVRMRDFIYTIDAVLRMFYSIFLIRNGGLLLHSAAAGLDGRAVLFVGETESGKSELSEMGQGDHLTDELSPVAMGDSGFKVYGSPFWGLFEKGGISSGLPLGATFFLFRNEETKLESASKQVMLRTLLRCVLNFSKEPIVAERVVTTCSNLLNTVPATKLLTPPSPELWPLVRRFLSETQSSGRQRSE